MADCARCVTPRRAVFLIDFTYEGTVYEIELCEKHVDLFDRELLAWARLAKERATMALVSVGVPDKPKPVNVHVPAHVTNGGIEIIDDRLPLAVDGEISPDAMAYTFTEHARGRMVGRKMTRADIFRALSARGKIVMPSKERPDCKVIQHDRVVAVVHPGMKRILTVYTREEFERLERKASGGN